MKSFKNLLDRFFPEQWHLVLVYKDEDDEPRCMTLAKYRTKAGVKWMHNCFATALPEKVGRSFVVMRMR